MGNRAVICTRESFDNNGVGVYLHWQGGETSIKAFLKYCELRGFRAPDEDNYGWARLVQVIANFMGADGLSVGIDTIDHLDCNNCDNGTYIIKGWKIVGHEYCEPTKDNYDFDELLKTIDESQPKEQQLGAWLTAKEVPVTKLKVGDKVYVKAYNGNIKKVTVLGFGEDEWRGGGHVKGVPFTNEVFRSIAKARGNVNSYIFTKTVKIVGE